MGKYKRIPVTAAKEIAKKYDKDQVIVITWDKAHGMMHVTTYGKTVEDCKQAAEGGNKLKEVLGFPEVLCKTEPARVRRAKKNQKELLSRLRQIDSDCGIRSCSNCGGSCPIGNCYNVPA